MFNLAYLGYGPSADALQNGAIAGFNIPGGVPVGAVTRAFAALGDGLTVLDFTDAQMARVNGDQELWTRYVIPAGTYPGQDKDIRTMAQPNFLAVHADVPEDVVYKITKTVYENLPFLRNIHKATAAMALDARITRTYSKYSSISRIWLLTREGCITRTQWTYDSTRWTREYVSVALH
jgi:TRAP transporter TAXI family solute receptor